MMIIKKNQKVITMNLKNLKYLKKGIMNLTPVQLSQGKVSGYIGMIVGLVLATYTTFYTGSIGLGIFLLFLCWFQIMSVLGEYKNLVNLKDMEISLQNQPSIEEFNEQLNQAEEEMEGK